MRSVKSEAYTYENGVSVFRLDLANYLLSQKFRILNLRSNRNASNMLVFYFEDKDGIKESIRFYLDQILRDKSVAD